MKVLVISHNPFSTYQNMGKSILSLIGGFNKEELSQLYIYPSIPDVEQCNSYYRITDKEVIVSEGRSLKGSSSFPVFVPAYKII